MQAEAAWIGHVFVLLQIVSPWPKRRTTKSTTLFNRLCKTSTPSEAPPLSATRMVGDYAPPTPTSTPLPIPPFLNLLSHSFAQTFAEVTFRLLLYFPPPVWPRPRPSSPSNGATPAVLQAGRGGAARRDSLTDWQPFPRPPLTDVTNSALGVLS